MHNSVLDTGGDELHRTKAHLQGSHSLEEETVVWPVHDGGNSRNLHKSLDHRRATLPIVPKKRVAEAGFEGCVGGL